MKSLSEYWGETGFCLVYLCFLEQSSCISHFTCIFGTDLILYIDNLLSHCTLPSGYSIRFQYETPFGGCKGDINDIKFLVNKFCHPSITLETPTYRGCRYCGFGWCGNYHTSLKLIETLLKRSEWICLGNDLYISLKQLKQKMNDDDDDDDDDDEPVDVYFMLDISKEMVFSYSTAWLRPCLLSVPHSAYSKLIGILSGKYTKEAACLKSFCLRTFWKYQMNPFAMVDLVPFCQDLVVYKEIHPILHQFSKGSMKEKSSLHYLVQK